MKGNQQNSNIVRRVSFQGVFSHDDESENETTYRSKNDTVSIGRASSVNINDTLPKAKYQLPLSSDDEDNTDDDTEDDDDDNHSLLSLKYSYISSKLNSLPSRINRSVPTSPQYHENNKLKQKQRKHSSFDSGISAKLPKINEIKYNSISNIKQFENDHSNTDDDAIIGEYIKKRLIGSTAHASNHLSMHQYKQFITSANTLPTAIPSKPNKQLQQLRMMSGMDLLLQREQKKAESKSQKIPKGDIKINGLLGKLPEPGALNINFQQLHQQKSALKSPKKQQNNSLMKTKQHDIYDSSRSIYHLPKLINQNQAMVNHYYQQTRSRQNSITTVSNNEYYGSVSNFSQT